MSERGPRLRRTQGRTPGGGFVAEARDAGARKSPGSRRRSGRGSPKCAHHRRKGYRLRDTSDVSRARGEAGRADRRTAGACGILVGDDPASALYVRNKTHACRTVGVASFTSRLPWSTTTDQLVEIIERFNA